MAFAKAVAARLTAATSSLLTTRRFTARRSGGKPFAFWPLISQNYNPFPKEQHEDRYRASQRDVVKQYEDLGIDELFFNASTDDPDEVERLAEAVR